MISCDELNIDIDIDREPNHLNIWNGSIISDVKIIREDHDTDLVLVSIPNIQDNVWCRLIKGFNNYSVIIDEIKYLFDIEKCGTIRTIIDNKRVTLIRHPLPNEEYFTLKDINKKDPIFKDQIFLKKIRKCLAFRNIMGIKHSNEKNIFIDNDYNKVYSYCEIRCAFKDNKTYTGVLSPQMIKKWFTCHNDINFTIMNDLLLENRYTDDFLKLREDIDYIINQIDPNYLWLTSNMLNYLASVN